MHKRIKLAFLHYIRVKPYKPFPPDLCSNFEPSGCSIHSGNAETCASYNRSLSPFPLLSSPAFNNLLKGVLLECTPQDTMIEKSSYLMIISLSSDNGE